ncbi:MAG: cation:proton antiporter [Puniceicoccales bacterium]|jgi:CPA2 family monovalent cation:H+ antiporter-2|nr:cation:proton antiporter [Puniceicoccales bacterium]
MNTGVTLLQDLSIVCAVSGMFALLFYYLKLPLLFGYLIGGFLIGPHFANWICGIESIEQLRELGVIFLMFYIGLEFDLGKLKRIFAPSAFWLTLQTIGMIALGMMIAPLLGWNWLNGLFLGSMLVMSSTMITIPLLKAKGALNTEHAQCAIGCLILEDILAIIFLVILSSIAGSGKLDLLEIKKSAFIIGVFVVMVFCIGKLTAPLFVRALLRSSSSEVLAVTVIGLTMAICFLAHYFEFSVALGAFLAGSILSQTNIAEQVDKTTEPLRDVFNAVFFTSIGMMIDARAIFHFLPWIVILSILTFVGQTFIGTVSLFLVGKKAETAFKAAFAKAQIGEFSFVIAALGNSLGVLHKDFMSVTVGVALGTILICAVFGNKVDNIFQFLSSKCPKFLGEVGKIYHNLLAEIKENISKNDFIKLTMRQLLLAILWFFLLSGTLVSVSWLAALTKRGEFGSILAATLKFLGRGLSFVSKAYGEQLSAARTLDISSNILQMCIWTTAFLICIPFLIGFVQNIQAIFINLTKSVFNKRTQKELLSIRLFEAMKAILASAALFLFSGIFLGIASRYLPSSVPIILFGTMAVIVAISQWKQLLKLNNKLELAFIESFNNKIETQEQIHRKSVLAKAAEKNPWPMEIHEISVKPNHKIAGMQLSELHLRELTGTTIIAISRGGLSTYRLGPDTQFFPGDRIILIGTKSQIESAKVILLAESDGPLIGDNSQFGILNFCIGVDKNFVGCLLSTLHMRQKHGLNVVGIQRRNGKISDIKSNMELVENDILLLAGTRSSIGKFKTEFGIE